MGVELELSVLLLLSIVGQSTFARFSLEIAVWRKIVKWLILTGITLGLYSVVRHWALLFPLVIGVAAMTVHFVWCSRNGIHPLRATPARNYYELRGWTWPEDYR